MLVHVEMTENLRNATCLAGLRYFLGSHSQRRDFHSHCSGGAVIRDDNSDDVLTELNFEERQKSTDERDPYTLAFSVSPIRLTTQVGTLAFMAPEILSHVNIAALQGGWVDNGAGNEGVGDQVIEEELEEKVSDEEKEVCFA